MGALTKSIGACGPTPAKGAELGRLQQNMAKNRRNVALLIALAFTLMVGRGVVL